MAKPRMTFWQIVNMNIGFFGIQFSFGLQQSSMSPIYKKWSDKKVKQKTKIETSKR